MPLLLVAVIPKKDRYRARDIALDNWHRSGYNRELAIEMCRSQAMRGGEFSSLLSAILIQVLIKLMIYFIEKWWNSREFNPPSTYQMGEVGF